MIGFDDFKETDLRVAKIAEVEDIHGKDKLYKIKISLGDEEKTIVAGLKGFYSRKDLQGKEIVVVANLKPANIAGIESQGMLLAADVEGRPVLIQPDKDVPEGTVVR